MSKNVLILSSSPRRGGNSDLLCDQFMRGANEAGNQVEKVFLADRKIGYCTGCELCLTSHACVQQDDMAAILEKMIAADVVVMATPVYFYSMSAQMKTLIDRTVPRYEEMNDKEFYFLATAAENSKQSMERTFDGLRGFIECFNGSNEKGCVYGAGAGRMGDIAGMPAMEQAYEMGKKV